MPMDPSQWALLASVFILGAMSPGPSLAIVLRNTMVGGRSQGISTGLGYGLGFGIYAFSAALAFHTVLSLNDSVQTAIKWAGTAILVWLGGTFLIGSFSENSSNPEETSHQSMKHQGFAQGFLIALFNPKILAWMIALYSPFIESGMGLGTLVGMGLLGMVIDGSWYVTVATVLTTGDRVDTLRAKSHYIEGAMGVIMLLFAGLMITGM